jgi:D-alanine-D-alanine ligase
MRRRVTDPREFGRVAVLMGGWSAERQVSLWSGEAVLAALRKRSVDAYAVDATRDNLLTLARDGYERAFIVLHGGAGEDGTVQAALELQGLPYTGSGVAGSAVKMNKVTAKRIWRAEGLPTADFRELPDERAARAAAKAFGLPFVIKPAAEGSSVGVTIVKKRSQVAPAFRLARGDDPRAPRAVMAERFVRGGEYTVAILDGVALPSIRIEPAGEFYDFHAKYIAEDTKYHCPAGLPAAREKKLRELALRAFALVGASGWGRVDFLIDKAGRPWVLELNTAPGMTSHSLVPMAPPSAGMGFDDLCWAILETSMPASGVADGR